MLKNLIPFFFAGLLTFTPYAEAQIVRRAAFDFGSGCIRVHVADVDTEKHQVVRTLYTDSVRLLLSEDLANKSDNTFSENLQNRALTTAEKLKAKALELKATQLYGIATEAYRAASNGEELVERYHTLLSIPVDIVSKEEGKFSFFTLAQESKLDPARMICFDIGGGSFQITYLDQKGEVKIYHGPYGRITAKNAILAHIKPKDSQEEIPSLNPVSITEWEKALQFMHSTLPIVPQDLLDKIKDPAVQVIGVAGHPPELASLGIYKKEDLIRVRDQYLGQLLTPKGVSLQLAELPLLPSAY